ncbi:hypothetical protein [Sphingomonas jatrophae]|uniref:Uncharacterized protein n=1 Tax=Sphingomonas jatrophae TaxID=1166337 RepID=A0A1I6M318_9SPHN|nr:hypothetical protein [Sphingomonas jatrophae]SFS10071.1 hypothetical protein SAMN05192580_3365 [Sphingomonas jatrophae]
MSLRFDRTAFALALLPLIAAAPAKGPDRCVAVRGKAIMARAAADSAGARGDRKVENARLDEALGALGSSYATPAMIDDTGMRLILARQAAGKGRLAQAATLKRRVLDERLQLCTIG